MLREIRGLEQRKKREIRRWFQDEGGEVQWFQLCYARDTWRERVLEWRRGRGFQHMKLRERPNPSRIRGCSRELASRYRVARRREAARVRASGPPVPPPGRTNAALARTPAPA